MGKTAPFCFQVLLIALDVNTAMPYNHAMYTVIETPVFQKLVNDVWSQAEREEFIAWIAANPLLGDVIRGSGGLRKIRWTRKGMGKRGGARVIYYNLLDGGSIYLLMIYTKTEYDNLPTEFLNRLRQEIGL